MRNSAKERESACNSERDRVHVLLFIFPFPVLPTLSLTHHTRCTHVVSLLTYSARATTFYHTHTHTARGRSPNTHTQHRERDTNTSTLSYGNWMSTSALRLFCFFSALRFVSFWFCFFCSFYLVFFFAPPFVILFILMSNATAHANWHCPKYANWIIKANQRHTQRARERERD